MPKVSGLALARALATKSAIDPAAESAFTARMIGIFTSPATGWKSALGSKGSDLKVLALAAWVELVVTNTV